MGQQQLLLIILSVIIVGVAIAAGLGLFSAGTVQSNKDAIIHDLNNLAANAYHYRVRPATLTGGAGSYAGFTIPSKMASNANASYTSTVSSAGDAVTFVAVSANNTVNSITAMIGTNGKFIAGGWTFTGDFQ